MTEKYVASVMIGIIFGFLLCLLVNRKKSIVKDVAISHPASW